MNTKSRKIQATYQMNTKYNTKLGEYDQVYHHALEKVLVTGKPREDRTGTGTIGTFGLNMVFRDVGIGPMGCFLPILTTKSVHFKSALHEMLWFMTSDPNIDYLKEHGVSIWDEWADENGSVGRIYGVQMRRWSVPGRRFKVDQVQNVVDSLKNDPWSRRHIISMWNPGELDRMALPPCPVMIQFYVRSEGNGTTKILDFCLTQRSGDMFLGVPFDIVGYTILAQMIANLCDMKLGDFHYNIGDAHIYKNHLDQVDEQLSRSSQFGKNGELPALQIMPNDVEIDDPWQNTIDDFEFDNFKLHFYNPHPKIPAPVST